MSSTEPSYQDLQIEIDQLREEIALLQKFGKNIPQFLHLLCNYDIRTPTIHIQSWSLLLLQEDQLTKDQKISVQSIYYATHSIFDAINYALAVTHLERTEEEAYKDEIVDLHVIFDRSIVYAQNYIRHVNEILHQSREIAKTSTNFIIGHDIISTNFIVDVPQIVPSAKGDVNITTRAIEIATHIALKNPLTREVFFKVHFDDCRIYIAIGWIELSAKEYLLNMFQQFEQAQTGFEFSDSALGLYWCWRMLKAQNGSLHFEICDEATHRMTITLVRGASDCEVVASTE